MVLEPPHEEALGEEEGQRHAKALPLGVREPCDVRQRRASS
jgi:hypothetical protein